MKDKYTLTFDIHLFNSGDERQFAWVFNHFYRDLRHMAARWLKEFPDQALTPDDIVTSAFLKLFYAPRHYPNLGAVRAMLYVTTRNELIDRYRHAYFRQAIERNASFIHVEENTIEKYRTEAEIFSIVDKIIQRMGERRKTIFIMRFYEGRQFSEIADHEGIAIGSVQGHIKKGLKYIRQTLNEDPDTLRIVLELLAAVIAFFLK